MGATLGDSKGLPMRSRSKYAQNMRGTKVQTVPAIQPIRATPTGGPFTRGNHRTTILVFGAPLLPANPGADGV